jgi:hypothetical protein
VRLDNPDATGYALPAMAACFLMAAGGLAVAARVLAEVRRKLSWIAAAAALGMTAATVLPDPAAFDRSDCNAARHLSVRALQDLPADTLILAADFNLVFMFDYLIRVEGIRPDVDVFYLRDLDNRVLRSALAREDPELEALLPGSGDLDRQTLLRLATRRPVAVDPGPHLDVRLLAWLHPRGLLWEVAPAGAPNEEEPLSERPGFFENLAPPLCGNGRVDPRTAEVVAWHAYWQAVAAHQTGRPARAGQMLAVAWCASPEDQTIAALAERPGLSLPTGCPRSRAVPVSTTRGMRPSAARAGMMLPGLAAWLIGLLGFGRKKKFIWLGLSLAGISATGILLALT